MQSTLDDDVPGAAERAKSTRHLEAEIVFDPKTGMVHYNGGAGGGRWHKIRNWERSRDDFEGEQSAQTGGEGDA